MSNGEIRVPGSLPRKLTSQELQRWADNDWALDNYEFITKNYPNEYVIVWRKQIVAHGPDAEQLYRECVTPERPKEELVLVAFPDPCSEIPADSCED
jgi:hypothetical protein